MPHATICSLYEALGFAPPEPTDRVKAGDRELVELLQAFLTAGAKEGPTLRLLRVYADSLRRITKAEAELYESRRCRKVSASSPSDLWPSRAWASL